MIDRQKTHLKRILALPLPLALALLAAAPLASAKDTQRAVPQSPGQVMMSYAPLVKQAAPAVVNIYTKKVVRQSFRSPFFDDPFFSRFFGKEFSLGPPRERIQNSLGSGVIVGAEGIVVTNHHVIQGADEITVALSDRREFEAKVMLTDERTDLAVLRIEGGGERFAHLNLMDSDEVQVGDLVLAIGNPFGVGQTVTSGIVSALARTQVGVADYRFFIQTDAAINPGNSGGAMVTMDGRLAGINTAIFSKSGGSIGIGFAIPANMVRSVVDSALSGGKLVRPWLGASGQAVTRDIAAANGLDRPGGVLINSLHKAGPAAEAGLRVGDVVTAVDGREVFDPEGLSFRVATRPLGGQVALSVIRRAKRLRIPVALKPAPEVPPRNISALESKHLFAGATIGNLSPAFAEEIGLDTLVRGVIVLEVAPGSRAARLRLKPGDIVLRINGTETKRVKDVVAAGQGDHEEWKISVRRGERVLNVVIRR